MAQTEKDILAASSIIERRKTKKEGYYQKIYITQTENSRELFQSLSSHWENSLFIGGSADQFLNAILYGTRNLIVVDSNPLAIHYILLKLAAIEKLENEEFLKFTSWHSKENMNFQDLLNQLEPLLDKNYPYFDRNPAQFWKALFTNYSKQEIVENLFYDGEGYDKHYSEKDMLLRNPYLEKKFYRYLKRILCKTNIQVVNKSIQEIDTVPNLPSLDKIYLSNILLEMNLSLEEYQQFLNEKIYPLLSSKGEAMIAYLNVSHTYGASLGNLGTIDEIIDFFINQGCHSELIFEPQIQRQISTAFVYQKK